MLFALKKGYLNMICEAKHHLAWEFCEKTSSQFVPYLIFGVVKNWRLSAEAIFAQKKIILPYCTGPLLERLRLSFSNAHTREEDKHTTKLMSIWRILLCITRVYHDEVEVAQ